MPESKCYQCGETFNAGSNQRLMLKEVAHYRASKAEDLGRLRGHHQCFDFVLDEKGLLIRHYGMGEWQTYYMGDEKKSGLIASI